jgi:hypothetical protein
MEKVADSVGAWIVTGTYVTPPWETVIVGLEIETVRIMGGGV